MHLTRVTLLPEKYPTNVHYPFNIETFHKTSSVFFGNPVTFFVGENGSGKSTLLEAIALKSGIHIWRNIQMTRFEMNPFEEELYRYIALEWTNGRVPGSYFSSEIFRDFSRNLEEWAVADGRILKYFGGKSLITQSHGQSLMSMFRVRYQIKGLYFMDEPETALSPKSQLELLHLLRDMGRSGHAQFIIATHSPILLSCPGAMILSFDHIPLKEISYEETEHYRIYKDFMDNRGKYLNNN